MSLLKREWIDIKDPNNPSNTFQFDITFLMSNWQCIFGRGCNGILDTKRPELNHGCCTHGAQFQDEEDRKRIAANAANLDADNWQFINEGQQNGFYEEDEGEFNTRIIDGACIFLNRNDFKTGPGCAFHFFADQNQLEYSETKPNVCWQLPISQEVEEDEDLQTITKVTEFTRQSWGEGGEDFAWWCTEDPKVFSNSQPVYKSLKNELTAIVGSQVYEELATYLDNRDDVELHPTEQLLTIGPKRG